MTLRVMSLCTAVALLQAGPSSTHSQSSASAAITFTDATQAAGLAAWRHVSGEPGKRYLIESTGSGVAFWDFDGDGRLDIYLVNGSTLDRVRAGSAAPSAALFRNVGDGTFQDVTDKAGVGNGRWGQGVCSGDVDNDGRPDLYVTNYGTSRLYRQTADGSFVDEARRAGLAVEGWSTGCAFADYDRDGWLDLYVAGYVSLDPQRLPPAPGDASAAAAATPPATPAGDTQGPQADGQLGMGASLRAGASLCTYRSEPVMCGPGGLPGAPDYLFRNNGDGTFRDVTREAGVDDTRRRYGFGVAWFDMDDDGWLDLLVANDSGPNHVYRNLGNGRFEDVSYLSGAALDGNGRSQAHMGIAIGDYDNDGRDDIHITNFADDFNVLYRNHDGATFSDVSYAAGVAQPSIPYLGWGTEFVDYDNDGWKDLLAVNGHVYPQADRLPWNTSYAQRALLFRNLQGKRFEEVGATAGPGLQTARVSRGAAVGDVDNDGDIDVVINQLDGPPALAVNMGGAAAGHWLLVRLRGDPAQKTPRDGIGSAVFVTAQGVRRRAEVASGRGQISQSDLRAHVGLGSATRVEALDVRWANGSTVRYTVNRVDTSITIDQQTGSVTTDR